MVDFEISKITKKSQQKVAQKVAPKMNVSQFTTPRGVITVKTHLRGILGRSQGCFGHVRGVFAFLPQTPRPTQG
jgi:hypothetical protein